MTAILEFTTVNPEDRENLEQDGYLTIQAHAVLGIIKYPYLPGMCYLLLAAGSYIVRETAESAMERWKTALHQHGGLH